MPMPRAYLKQISFTFSLSSESVRLATRSNSLVIYIILRQPKAQSEIDVIFHELRACLNDMCTVQYIRTVCI